MYSGLGVAASIRDARKAEDDVDVDDEIKALPEREEALLASLRASFTSKRAKNAASKKRPEAVREAVDDSPSPKDDAEMNSCTTAPAAQKAYMTKAERRKTKKLTVANLLTERAAAVPEVPDIADEFSNGRGTKRGADHDMLAGATAPVKNRGSAALEEAAEMHDGPAKKRRKKQRIPSDADASDDIGPVGGVIGGVPTGRDTLVDFTGKRDEEEMDGEEQDSKDVEYERGLVLALEQKNGVRTASGGFPKGHLTAMRAVSVLLAKSSLSLLPVIPHALFHPSNPSLPPPAWQARPTGGRKQ